MLSAGANFELAKRPNLEQLLILYYRMVKPCPLCWVRCQMNSLWQAQWPTQDNNGLVEAIPWYQGPGWKIQHIFYHHYECMTITSRLCHIIWSSKWHNLLTQTLILHMRVDIGTCISYLNIRLCSFHLIFWNFNIWVKLCKVHILLMYL
jgi:hypothetical protein